MLYIYLAVLIAASYWVIKTLGPEMAKPPLSKVTPVPKSSDPIVPIEPDKRTEKLEILVIEKNKNLSLLQNELRGFHAQAQSFDKVKTLMENEIHRLREQNRIFRSELGLPPITSSHANIKENSIT